MIAIKDCRSVVPGVAFGCKRHCN